jgi:hypothetical protein
MCGAVSKAPPHPPILLDFGLTKTLRPAMKVALAKQLLAAAEVRPQLLHGLLISVGSPGKETMLNARKMNGRACSLM